MTSKPIIAITMSEAAGIGPEILAKALHNRTIYQYCRPLAIGDLKVMQKAAAVLGLDMQFKPVDKVSGIDWNDEAHHLVDMANMPLSSLEEGKPNATTGRAMLEYTRKAVDLYLAGEVDGAVGGPHSKKAAEEAGEHFDGYPGLIAQMTNSKHPFLMLVSGRLRVSNVTLHVSLRKALQMLDEDLVYHCIRETDKAVRGFGIEKPRIAVSGLNPHAGEARMFGDEDIDIIAPAISRAQNEGINASGPYPADSLFYGCQENDKYDAYVAMYHDQAHIPVKVVAFKSAAAVAIGVPVNWATVDHGCALDIAWKGIADPAVIEEAIRLISTRAETFRKYYEM